MMVPWIFFSIFIAVLATGCGRQDKVLAKQDSGPIPIHVSRVVVKEIRRAVDSVGTLFPFDESVVSAEIDGRVDQVNVDLGDRVKAGQVMVHISDEEQRYLLEQNEAQLRQALERLGLKNEDEKVKDIKDTPEPRRAQADLFDAEQRYKRTQNLFDQGIASQSDMDTAQARFKSLQASYDTTLYQTRNLVSEVERTRAMLDLQRKKLRDTSVRAPFDSYVKERQITVGQYVRVNTPLMTLVKTDPIRLRIEIPERMAPWVRNGQIAGVSIEAFDNRKFEGKIWRISPTVDQSKRTFIAEALVPNPSGELKPGSYAKAHVPTERVERIHLVPFKAVNYVFGANKVYVVNGNSIETREVKLGDRFDEQVEIVEGLHDDEQVATSNLNLLDTGSHVQPQN